MPRSRKTIDIAEVLRMGNHFLEFSKREQIAERTATASFLESMLSTTGNYKGFRYLEAIHSDGKLVTLGDESRREYYS